MAQYLPIIETTEPESVRAQPGQWLRYNGTLGRYMGRRRGTVWIAWEGTARKRFDQFAQAFNDSVRLSR